MPDLPDHIEVIAKTPGLRHEDIEVVVSLPTFRRPEHLIRTLDTLNAQVTKRRWAVVVIENETEKGRRNRCRSAFRGWQVSGYAYCRIPSWQL